MCISYKRDRLFVYHTHTRARIHTCVSALKMYMSVSGITCLGIAAFVTLYTRHVKARAHASMHARTCMYVCMFLCMYICMHILMYIGREHVYVITCDSLPLQKRYCDSIYASCRTKHIQIHTYICAYIHMHIYTYT